MMLLKNLYITSDVVWRLESAPTIERRVLQLLQINILKQPNLFEKAMSALRN